MTFGRKKVFTERELTTFDDEDKTSTLTVLASLHRLKIFRVVLFSLLVMTGVLSGVLSYILLSKQEHTKYILEFEFVANEVYTRFDQGFQAKLLVADHMSTIFSYACPDSHNWPNCSGVPQQLYEDITSSPMEIAKLRAIGVSPLVYSDQKDSFEEFAYARFDAEGFPEQTGISPFGRGIYATYLNGTRYADDGKTNFSDHEVFLPAFHTTNVDKNWPAIMYNMHSEQVRATAIDAVLDCSSRLEDVQKDGSSRVQRCSSITDFIQLVSDALPNPASTIYSPIFPHNSNSSVVGMTMIIFNWASILETPADFGDRSIECEVETSVSGETLSRHLFLLSGGGAKFKGNADDSSNKLIGDQISFTSPLGANISTNVAYTLHFRPTLDFYNSFHSLTPTFAGVVCVAITLAISGMFSIYNLLVKREALENKMLLDSKRVFVKFISHEIRTPMNCITLGLQLLASRLMALDKKYDHSRNNALQGSDELTELEVDVLSHHGPSETNNVRRSSHSRFSDNEAMDECLEIVKEISESSKTAAVVLNELINYDKIEMEKFRIERRMCNIIKILTETFRPLEVPAKQQGVDFSLQLNEEMGTVAYVLGDEIKMGQVFRNIMSNALKFTPFKGRIIVQASVERHERFTTVLDPVTREEFKHVGDFVVSVTDTGPGLTTQHQQQMFQEGVQFNANELQAGGGSGLGMWISKEIVKQHGGSVKVFSEGLGKGCTFSVAVPALQPVKEGYQNVTLVPTYSDEISDLTTTKLPRRVLLVDDSAMSLKILSRLLQNIGVRDVSVVHDGKECLDVVRKSSETFDLIVMDFEMPVLNGPDATRCLRSSGCKVPIIGVTGNALAEDKKLFSSAGVDEVLAKPVTIHQLINAYNKMIPENKV